MSYLMDRSGLVPTEDTIEALLDHLVNPLLPIRESFDEAPTDDQQMMVANQMHAVVILYNYYHRKQFPKLDFLDFEPFCKLSCIAKPGLLSYLRYMHGCEEDSENLNNQLSITEKMVINTCNICVGLDSSKNNPIIEGWPISKVAVFLVDPTKEICVLQFSSITQGVWSLVEKVLEARHENGSSQKGSNESEEELEQLAFSAVEQETGISRSDLSILESHLTYSLSHEKTTARLYIMKYGTALSEDLTQVAIKDVIRSLEGPIVKKDLTYEVTSVVEYYNMLPYIEIISSWLSRENTHHDCLDRRGQEVVKEDNCSLEPDGLSSAEEDREVKIKFVSNEPKVDIRNRKPNKSETLETNKNDLSSINGSSEAANGPENRAGSPCIEQGKLSIMNDQATNDKPMQNGQDKNVRKAAITSKAIMKHQEGTINSVECANQDGCASGDLPLVPMQFNSSDLSKFYHAMASKENDLLQASLRVFQKKRDDLYYQKRMLQDEIAHCEMNIQTILREEGKDSLTLKVESIIEALNSLSSNQVRICTNPFSVEQSPSPTIKRRKLFEAVLSSVNSCQELDDICHKNSWILPRYTVLPSCQIAGMFEATVTIHGTDFECTTTSNDPKSSPHEARESAATNLLNTLRTWQASKEE